MNVGTITNLVSDRGFGFIRRTDGTDIFFHASGLAGIPFEHCFVDMEVEFEVERRQDGRDRAIMVKRVAS